MEIDHTEVTKQSREIQQIYSEPMKIGDTKQAGSYEECEQRRESGICEERAEQAKQEEVQEMEQLKVETVRV